MGKKANSILTLEDVQHLRELEEAGTLNTKAAAQAFGVNTETIRRAVRGDTWKKRISQQSDEVVQSSLEKLQEAIAQKKRNDAVAEELLSEGEAAAKSRGYLE